MNSFLLLMGTLLQWHFARMRENTGPSNTLTGIVCHRDCERESRVIFAVIRTSLEIRRNLRRRCMIVHGNATLMIDRISRSDSCVAEYAGSESKIGERISHRVTSKSCENAAFGF